MDRKLKKDFYLQDTSIVAKNLLGKILCRRTDRGLMAGKIVETEAYLAENDPACHAYIKVTKRNRNMFEEGGIAYVYLIYGFYYCFNVVTGLKDRGEAVLIRALEPLQGIEIMQSYRDVEKIRDLTNGPGKLCLAMNINKNDDGENLITGQNIYITDGEKIKKSDIHTTTRIGLTKGIDLPLRFYVRNNNYVSKIAREE